MKRELRQLIDSFSDEEMLKVCQEINTICFDKDNAKETLLYTIIMNDLEEENCRIAEVSKLFNGIINETKKRIGEELLDFYRLKIFHERPLRKLYLFRMSGEGEPLDKHDLRCIEWSLD